MTDILATALAGHATQLSGANDNGKRQPLPALGSAARLISVLDAILDLGHGDLAFFEEDLPFAPTVVRSWAELHGLAMEVSEMNVLRVRRRDGVRTLVAVHQEEA